MIPSALLCGLPGTGVSFIGRAIADTIPKLFPSVHTFYLPLFADLPDASVYDIIEHFIPNFDERHSEQKAMLVVDNANVLQDHDNHLTALRQSLCFAINRGTQVLFLGKPDIDPELLQRKMMINSDRMCVYPDLGPMRQLDEIWRYCCTTHGVEAKQEPFGSELDALVLSYWLTGGHPAKAQAMYSGNMVIADVIAQTIQDLNRNADLRRVTEEIIDAQSDSFKHHLSECKSFQDVMDMLDPFQIVTCSLSIATYRKRNLFSDSVYDQRRKASLLTPLMIPLLLASDAQKFQEEVVEFAKKTADQLGLTPAHEYRWLRSCC